MLWIWKHYRLTAVVCIIFVMHLAEPYELDQDVVITRVTETSIAIMSWGYTGIPPSAFYNRRIERKKMDSFEVVLNHFPLNGKNDLYGVFENKTVLFNETADNVTVTVYDFEQQFHGEYRLSVDQSIGPPAISGLTVFYLCLVPKTANLTGPDSQTLGTNINMTCAVESNSLGEEYRKNVTRIYYWEVNNNPVVAGDDYEFNNNIEENSVNSSLIIKNIRAEMNGNNYTCFAVEDGCEIDSPKSSPYMLQAEIDPQQDKCKWWCILIIVLVVVSVVVIIICCCCWHYKVACFAHKSSAQIDVNQKQETNGFGMENKAY